MVGGVLFVVIIVNQFVGLCIEMKFDVFVILVDGMYFIVVMFVFDFFDIVVVCCVQFFDQVLYWQLCLVLVEVLVVIFIGCDWVGKCQVGGQNVVEQCE